MNSSISTRHFSAALRVLAVSTLLGSVVVAQAAGFSVGRVEVEFSDGNWKEVALPAEEVAYGGEKAGALDVESKLFVQDLPGDAGQVLVLVGAHSEGIGGGRAAYMTYSTECKPDEQNFREGNAGFRASFSQCLMVTPLYSGPSVFKALAPQLMNMSGPGAVDNQYPVYTVWSRHAISTGSFVDVRVFVRKPIAVEPAAADDAIPKGVPLEHVAWGRQLKDAVKSSVYSISGRLVIPPLRLPSATPAPAAEKSAGG